MLHILFNTCSGDCRTGLFSGRRGLFGLRRGEYRLRLGLLLIIFF